VARAVAARVAVLPVVNRAPSATVYRPTPSYEEPAQVYQQTHVASVKAENYETEYDEEAKPNRKALIYAAAGVALLLAAGGYGFSHMHSKAAVTPVSAVAPQQTTVINAPKPMAAIPATQVASAAPTNAATADTGQRPLTAQTNDMKNQLSAPSRIANDLGVLGGKEAPPPSASLGMGGMESMNAGGGIFSGQNGPKVKVAPTKVPISAGVSVGLLMQSNPPRYPQNARIAHVTGTVVIQVTISKAGMVENPHVVSGPAMLRQAALDAVKTWRYRPYLLDGQPVEVETAVNVVFTM